MLTQNQIGVLYMVGSVICFSIMDICVKWLDYYPIGQVLFLRFFIGFIPIFFIIPKDKIFSFYKTSRPGLHAFRAICGALAIIALFFGYFLTAIIRLIIPINSMFSYGFAGFASVYGIIFYTKMTFDEIVLISSARELIGLSIFCLIGFFGGIFFNQSKEFFLKVLIHGKNN